MALLTKEDISQLQADIEKKKEQIQAIQENILNQQAEIKSIEENLGQKLAEFEDVSKDQKSLQSLVNQFVNNIKDYQDIIDIAEARKSEFEKAVDQAKVAGDDEKAKYYISLVKQQDETIADTNTKIEQTKADQEDAQVQLDEATANLKKIQTEVDERKADLDKINQELFNTQKEEDEAKNELIALENSTLLNDYNNQVASRKEHARSMFKDVNRLKPLVRNEMDPDLDEEKAVFESDSKLFMEDIKAELSVDEALINSEIDKLIDNEKIFKAAEAFSLARTSLFDLSIGDVNEKIKAACRQGMTSLDFEQFELSGTQLLALDRAGYKITHSDKDVADGAGSQVITIEWGLISVA